MYLPDDDLRIETCRSNFNVLMFNFYVCASAGILIKYFDDVHGATIRMPSLVCAFHFKAEIYIYIYIYIYILKKREEQRLEAAQMKFLRHLLGITKLDKENNHCIRQKMGVQNTVKEIKQDQKKWLQHVQRMDSNRLPKQALNINQKDEGT